MMQNRHIISEVLKKNKDYYKMGYRPVKKQGMVKSFE